MLRTAEAVIGQGPGDEPLKVIVSYKPTNRATDIDFLKWTKLQKAWVPTTRIRNGVAVGRAIRGLLMAVGAVEDK